VETRESELTVPMCELIPHRHPMVLVDRLIEATADGVVCGVEISSESPYATSSGVSNIVALECMAQAVSVFVGLSDRREGKPVRDGYLIGVNDARFDVDGFAVGTELLVSAKRIWGGEPLASFECKTTVDDTEAASVTLNVYRVPQVEDEP
jgi:predicted hotdog family 3-hydroxylacyl-ACP dehydratase